MSDYLLVIFVALVSGTGLILRLNEVLSKDRGPEDTKSRWVFDSITQVAMLVWSIAVLIWGDL